MTTIAEVNVPLEVHKTPGHSDEPQESISREVRPVPERYRNAIGKYKVTRLASCIACGRCAELCPQGVHVKPEGYTYMLRPQDHRCIGPACAKTDHYCISQCPAKALVLRLNPNVECLGDPRWTGDLILSTWHEAETGQIPPPHLEYRHGDSGGGFDRIRFKFEVPEFDNASQICGC